MRESIKYLIILIITVSVNAIALISRISLEIKWTIAILILLFILIKERKISRRLFKTLIISSSMVIIFWRIFDVVFFSKDCLEALIRLWLLILVGYLIGTMTSAESLIDALLYINVNINIILFVIIIYNAFDYFMQAYKLIKYSYELRFGKNKIIEKNFRILLTMCMDFIMLLSECEKISELEQDRLIASIERRTNK